VVEYPQLERPFSLKNIIHRLKQSRSKDKDMGKAVDIESYKPFDTNSQNVQLNTDTSTIPMNTDISDITTESDTQSQTNTQTISSIQDPPQTPLERNGYIEYDLSFDTSISEDLYDSPLFDIFTSLKKGHLNKVIEPYTKDEGVYYVVAKDPSPASNEEFSLKLKKYEGIYMVTGEIIIIILLVSILTELQKLTMIQRNNMEK